MRDWLTDRCGREIGVADMRGITSRMNVAEQIVSRVRETKLNGRTAFSPPLVAVAIPSVYIEHRGWLYCDCDRGLGDGCR
ncbi:hypothetical protein ACIBG0_04015 [Nocardia sp. NPDC050630]|uniref:hypothetical protein n=1 Tax=Nocardia sp. NPDC050630 TaxID=3364321 RepID=UPI0037BBC426